VTAVPHLHVVGLGPAGAAYVTAESLDLLGSVRPVVLRTRHHPAAEELTAVGGLLHGAATCDDVYDDAERLDDVYPAIVRRLEGLLSDVGAGGQVLYVVPGSPGVAERTVELLRLLAVGDDGVRRFALTVHPALSFADLAWVRLGIDPLAEGVRIVDGQRFAAEAAGERGPLLVAQCDSRAVLSDIKLAVDEGPEDPVLVIQRLGLPDEQIVEVAWEDLDREIDPDHLTSLYIPTLAAPVAGEVMGLVDLMHTLRAECPWDREQTHQSLVRHLVEEAYEVVEALEALPTEDGSADDEAVAAAYGHLEEELGDLLFQIVFHAELATESGRFGLADVARNVHDKLYARHPHVFPSEGGALVDVDGARDVEANWERIKRAEKARTSAMDGIPGALPALLLSYKSHERADRAGLSFPSVESAVAKVREELAEVEAEVPGGAVEAELGDLLFAAVGLAHELDVEPEGALRAAAGRFQARFRAVEQLATAEGVPLAEADQASLDRWWDAAKSASPPPSGVPEPRAGQQ
jgi:tetrapyrrole methylase family protein/MazG family protein